MDPGYSPANRQIIEENAKILNIPITIFESDIFDSVYNVEKNHRAICAPGMRRDMYSKARELGCNKIALGHHYDDVIETILMGMLYGAQVQTMMPKLHSTNFEGMELIRPLYLVREDDIKKWSDSNGLHFIQCACKFTDTCSTCGSENTSKDNKRRYAPGWVHSTCLLRGFPKGATPHLAHDFAEQSVVCYTLCRRCPENTVAAGEGKGI